MLEFLRICKKLKEIVRNFITLYEIVRNGKNMRDCVWIYNTLYKFVRIFIKKKNVARNHIFLRTVLRICKNYQEFLRICEHLEEFTRFTRIYKNL